MKNGKKKEVYSTISPKRRQPQGQGIFKDNTESKSAVKRMTYKARLAEYAKKNKLTLQQAAVAMMLEEESKTPKTRKNTG